MKLSQFSSLIYSSSLAIGFQSIISLGFSPQVKAINITTDPNSSPVIVPGVTAGVTGDQMNGLTVTVEFAPLTNSAETQTVAWVTNSGTQSGKAETDDWILEQTGNTFDFNSWTFTNKRNDIGINRLTLTGGGSIFFDRSGPDSGTPGSSSGRDIATTFADPNNVLKAIYSEPIILMGEEGFAGDLWAQLTIDFSELSNGFVGTFQLTQDTDRVVPEPLTILGAGTAAGFGAFFKRKLNKKKQ